MRTVILLGAIIIADASRIRTADINGEAIAIIFLISAGMDITDFVKNLIRK